MNAPETREEMALRRALSTLQVIAVLAGIAGAVFFFSRGEGSEGWDWMGAAALIAVILRLYSYTRTGKLKMLAFIGISQGLLLAYVVVVLLTARD